LKNLNYFKKFSGLVIFLLALILFGCEDPNEIGLELVPDKDKVGVFRAEIPLDPKVFLKDSINTSRVDPRNLRLLAGSYNDTYFGEVISEGYVELTVDQDTYDPIPENAVFTGLKLFLKVNYRYGEEIPESDSVNYLYVHQLADGFASDSIPESRDETAYEAEALGSVNYDVNILFDSDSVLTFNLDEQEGLRLFERAKNTNNDSTFFLSSRFVDFFKGLAIIPDPQNVAVMGISVSASSMRLDYEVDGEDESIFMRFRGRYYSRVVSDLTGTPLEGLYENPKGFETDDNVMYFQNGTGIIPYLDFEPYFQFVDTVGEFAINDARLMIKVKPYDQNTPPPSRLLVFPTDSTFEIFSNSTFSGAQYFSLNNVGAPGLVTSLVPLNFNNATLTYDQQNPGTFVNVTVFLETILSPGSINKLMLYPYFSQGFNSISQTVDRFVSVPEESKLIIYYTKVN